MRTVKADQRLSAIARQIANERAPQARGTLSISDRERVAAYSRAVQRGMIMTRQVPEKYRAFVNA